MVFIVFIILPLANAAFPKYFMVPEHSLWTEHCAGYASDPHCFLNSAVGDWGFICCMNGICMPYDCSVLHASELLCTLSSCHYSEHRRHGGGTSCTLLTHQAKWSRWASFRIWQLEVWEHHVELLLIHHQKKTIIASLYGTSMSFEPDLWTCSKSLGDCTSRPCCGYRLIPDYTNP